MGDTVAKAPSFLSSEIPPATGARNLAFFFFFFRAFHPRYRLPCGVSRAIILFRKADCWVVSRPRHQELLSMKLYIAKARAPSPPHRQPGCAKNTPNKTNPGGTPRSIMGAQVEKTRRGPIRVPLSTRLIVFPPAGMFFRQQRFQNNGARLNWWDEWGRMTHFIWGSVRATSRGGGNAGKSGSVSKDVAFCKSASCK